MGQWRRVHFTHHIFVLHRKRPRSCAVPPAEFARAALWRTGLLPFEVYPLSDGSRCWRGQSVWIPLDESKSACTSHNTVNEVTGKQEERISSREPSWNPSLGLSWTKSKPRSWLWPRSGGEAVQRFRCNGLRWRPFGLYATQIVGNAAFTC